MADVFDLLRKDHEEVKALLGALTSGSADQQKLAEKLVMEESRHEAVEEMYFWPSVRENVEGGAKLADEGIAQEDEGKKVLDQLRKADPGTPEFTSLVQKFVTAGSAHIAFEESEVWPLLERTLSTSERSELGQKIDQAKASAPTRPHPHAPASPGALKTVGAATAAADKLADKVTDRGE